MLKRLLAAAAVIPLLSVGCAAWPAAAAPSNISQTVGVCDPLWPQRCIKPNVDGSINTSGGGGSTGATATAATPTRVEGSTNNPPSQNLFGAQRFQWEYLGTPINPTDPVPIMGADGLTVASNTNPLPTTAKAATTGGTTQFTVEVAASDNHQNIKGTAGTLYSLSAFSVHTAAMFLRLYDAASGFNGCNSATNLKWEGNIPAASTGSGFAVPIPPMGWNFASGIALCVTGAYGNTNTTAATVSVASVNGSYQ